VSASGASKYPQALAFIERMPFVDARTSPAPAAAFTLGPAVLRAPPAIARGSDDDLAGLDLEPRIPNEGGATDEMLGELVDMVFVSAEDNGGQHEVHLVFKAEVLGGLHLRLRKQADGMHATFVVEDAAARRAVSDHVDGLVAHLKGRGFTIASHAIEIAP
jgi:hypothetical protein